MLATQVVKRTGEVVDFDAQRIRSAIARAVAACGQTMPDTELDAVVDRVCEEVASRFREFFPNVENIQDLVEKHLVLAGRYEIAKAYILYRADRQQARSEARERAAEEARLGRLTARKRDGRKVLFNVRTIENTVRRAAEGLDADAIDVGAVVREVVRNVFDGVTTAQIERAVVLAATAFIERDPAYSPLAARLLLQKVTREVIGASTTAAELPEAYRRSFGRGIATGIAAGLLDPRLAEFDLDRLAAHLDPGRDHELRYLGVQTLYDRYFLRQDDRCLELPQTFWMRVAMGLAVEESDREARAEEFYDVMSRLHYVPSTPTLFHAGTRHPQLSSCYLTTIDDDLRHIFKCLGDNSQLSKWSGGIGNDWTRIRATGARIRSTNVESQGVVPFLKIANDVTMAINRSGKRRGATCAYLETWHHDIEDFLDLRRNTGDERRRTHDMNTASWIPDLFMQRVEADAEWTLFSPDETPDLHDLYGRAFRERYEQYEAAADRGEIRLFKRMPATQLWRKMLTMLYETGHPWITFKDACNVRSPQDHAGVIHSSNLCTEITLNTSAAETAVCNLGSVNLARHVDDGRLDTERLATTVRTAIRMLDNVIDINFYPTEEARRSNLQHRPIGLGLMGFQDALFQLGLPFDSAAALEFADASMEHIAYHAILTSSELARERGAYGSYRGSKWDRGLFPQDTLDLLERERGEAVDVSRESRLDWTSVREHVSEHGMRNSNTMAIAPTATISNIAGCFPCIEPIYKNIYVKANISGEFTVVNSYLVQDLKAHGLWNDEMLEQLKFQDGDISAIPEVPQDLKDRYQEAFAIDPRWAVRMTAARGKWIDQSQSHNVFMRGVSGKLLGEIYRTAWRCGLKTTYYLRSLAATQIEKSTLDAGKYGFTQKRDQERPSPVAMATAAPAATAAAPAMMAAQAAAGGRGDRSDAKLCRIEDPDCEACQ